MGHQPEPDACEVCGDDLPADPPTVTLPTGFSPRMSPLASPGIRRVAFCSERHRRDWLDAARGEWPDGDDGDADDGDADAADTSE